MGKYIPAQTSIKDDLLPHPNKPILFSEALTEHLFSEEEYTLFHLQKIL